MIRSTVFATLATLTAGPLLAQATAGQMAATPPTIEGPDEIDKEGIDVIPGGNHTFRNDMPVDSKIVANSENGLNPDGPLRLAPPNVVLDGFSTVPMAEIDPAELDGVPVWQEASEEFAEITRVVGNDEDTVIVALPWLLADWEVAVPIEAFTFVEAEESEERRAYIAASEEMLRTLPRWDG
ncbi:hypothetical protein [Pontivivens ytuae]|uniref:Uncharacterized protein n=1 Tax=Pontivivens ytuae TaxID=2789856 RepID=A0A7S9QBP4_9RHOB|nr:hypothetical protein [Pontivivens ytuae]QPH52955.1 hypothetical protein I0K15_14215 [Pontivivens ytuae]